jgi:hypothetical protein
MTDNKDKQESHLTRRQFIIYSSAASAVAAGVILKTDAMQNAPQNMAPLNDGSHGIYGYT